MDCAICFEALGEDDSLTQQGALCPHIYHNRCIAEWLAANDNCPMCRAIWRPVLAPIVPLEPAFAPRHLYQTADIFHSGVPGAPLRPRRRPDYLLTPSHWRREGIRRRLLEEFSAILQRWEELQEASDSEAEEAIRDNGGVSDSDN